MSRAKQTKLLRATMLDFQSGSKYIEDYSQIYTFTTERIDMSK